MSYEGLHGDDLGDIKSAVNEIEYYMTDVERKSGKRRAAHEKKLHLATQSLVSCVERVSQKAQHSPSAQSQETQYDHRARLLMRKLYSLVDTADRKGDEEWSDLITRIKDRGEELASYLAPKRKESLDRTIWEPSTAQQDSPPDPMVDESSIPSPPPELTSAPSSPLSSIDDAIDEVDLQWPGRIDPFAEGDSEPEDDYGVDDEDRRILRSLDAPDEELDTEQHRASTLSNEDQDSIGIVAPSPVRTAALAGAERSSIAAGSNVDDQLGVTSSDNEGCVHTGEKAVEKAAETTKAEEMDGEKEVRSDNDSKEETARDYHNSQVDDDWKVEVTAADKEVLQMEDRKSLRQAEIAEVQTPNRHEGEATLPEPLGTGQQGKESLDDTLSVLDPAVESSDMPSEDMKKVGDENEEASTVSQPIGQSTAAKYEETVSAEQAWSLEKGELDQDELRGTQQSLDSETNTADLYLSMCEETVNAEQAWSLEKGELDQDEPRGTQQSLDSETNTADLYLSMPGSYVWDDSPQPPTAASANPTHAQASTVDDNPEPTSGWFRKFRGAVRNVL